MQSQKKQLMMWEALREATDEEMERDPTVCVMGEMMGGRNADAAHRCKYRYVLPCIWELAYVYALPHC